MLTYSELKKGTVFISDGEPYEVLESQFVRMQQRKPVMQTKIRNLISGKVESRNFHQNETFKEGVIERREAKFLYTHRGEFWFTEPENPKERFLIKEELLGEVKNYLKANELVTLRMFEHQIIGAEVPIKMEFIVKETPPGFKGDTAQGGSKIAKLENGSEVQVPLFINEGDTVIVNTQTGQYVSRGEKE
ncbi:elongation factor P [Candidatus Uhrbacteria bacterium]|nr:elongation factor P [Candidatus Uhrbacteria bacterium]MBI2175488.1 elongation factor P [Parcubacteria group bacterium]